MVAEQENNRNEEEEAKQNRINKILNKAITYIRNGQQSEAIRELAKEDLQQVAIPKNATTQEITEMVAKLFRRSRRTESNGGSGRFFQNLAEESGTEN